MPHITRYQTPRLKGANRKDHIWIRLDSGFKCCLCGAVIRRTSPPDYPTPAGWIPEAYEPLSDSDRLLVPPLVEDLKRSNSKR